MKKRLHFALPSLLLSLWACGCHIENHPDDSVGPQDTSDTCGSYCLHLYECASISDVQLPSCLDQCSSKIREDAVGTVSACQCVLDDECRALDAYDCPGAPMPSTPSGGDGSANVGGASNAGNSGGAGNASSAGGSPATGGGVAGATSNVAGAGSTPLGCQGGYDCGDSEDCVQGACRQRCTASCQCPTDLSCIEHYCRSAVPAPACATDCECASGQHCISGSCG